MSEYISERRDYGFVIGLFTGTLVGAGLALCLAPRAGSGLRERATHSARSLRTQASGRYQQVSARVGEAVDELARKARAVRHDVADAVATGAHEVERLATAAGSDRGSEAAKPPAADRQSHTL
jgi:gas vesicle protein